MPTRRKPAATVDAKPAKPKRQPRASKPKKVGRPTKFNPNIGREICTRMAEGASLPQACKALGVEERTAYRWMIAQPEFCQDVYRARELRGDLAFGEQILGIADDTENDYKTAINGRKVPDKELVLRSKIRIEARQFHMRQLHPQTWGERTQGRC